MRGRRLGPKDHELKLKIVVALFHDMWEPYFGLLNFSTIVLINGIPTWLIAETRVIFVMKGLHMVRFVFLCYANLTLLPSRWG